MSKPIIGIMYDFDKTLSTTDMQNYDFIPNLGMTPDQFWGLTTEFAEKSDVERTLSYMFCMINEAKKKGIKITRKYLNSCGKNIQYYDGVESWFDRINKFGEKHGVKVEHYLVSSGTLEIVEGCSIFKKFTKCYGCEFYFDEKTKEPIWPKLAINYTQKTQFFFRIAKGVNDITDDVGVNKKRDKDALRIPYSNIIYIGDGMTDIPCMTLVNKNGGTSIAVYPKKGKDKVKEIKSDGRVKYLCPADYSKGSDIESVLKLVIESVALKNKFKNQEEEIDKHD